MSGESLLTKGGSGLRFPASTNRRSVGHVPVCLIGAVVLIASVTAADAGEFIVSVPGIPGPYCAYGAEKRLLEIAGVGRVNLLWKAEQIRVIVDERSSITAADIENAMKKADYPYRFTVSTQR
jgi:hypothetical protein